MKTIALVLLYCVWCVYGKPTIRMKNGPIFRTVVTTRNVTQSFLPQARKNTVILPSTTPHGTYIDVQVVDKPHNLFIGRCTRELNELHNENIILSNDGKSHVSAEIEINVDKPVDIKCVKVIDQNVGVGAYPSYIGGGVGHNFVVIGVSTKYGKGFHFFIQIMGNMRNQTVTEAKMKTANVREKIK